MGRLIDADSTLEMAKNGIWDTVDLEEILKYSPTVNAEPVKHGYWTEKRWTTEDDWGVFNNRKEVCSVCSIEQDERSDYCPNCGAKMSKGVNKYVRD